MFSECAQSGDFLYLTGISQSGALAAITAGSGGSAPHFTLFTPSIEPERERWDGARLRGCSGGLWRRRGVPNHRGAKLNRHSFVAAAAGDSA
jgi:hypothetical protein